MKLLKNTFPDSAWIRLIDSKLCLFSWCNVQRKKNKFSAHAALHNSRSILHTWMWSDLRMIWIQLKRQKQTFPFFLNWPGIHRILEHGNHQKLDRRARINIVRFYSNTTNFQFCSQHILWNFFFLHKNAIKTEFTRKQLTFV